MRKNMISAAALSWLLLGSAGFAQDQQAPTPAQPPRAQQQAPTSMQLPTPGDEIKALAPAFGRSMTWTETVPAGEMGPGSKEMLVKAQADCRTIAGGFAYSCPIQMVMGQGKEAMQFSGEMVVAYDQSSGLFRSFSVFNDGSVVPMAGKLEGKVLTLESTEDFMEMGKRVRGRMTFDLSDPNNVKFTESHKEASGEWKVASETVMKPASPTRAGRRGP